MKKFLLFLILFTFIFLLSPLSFATETLEILTYYPAPYGVYSQLQTGVDEHKLAIGSLSGNPFTNSISYIGFNTIRNATTSDWLFDGNGTGSGGAIIYATITGELKFVPVASYTTQDNTYPDNSLLGKDLLTLSETNGVTISIHQYPGMPIFTPNYNALTIENSIGNANTDVNVNIQGNPGGSSSRKLSVNFKPNINQSKGWYTMWDGNDSKYKLGELTTMTGAVESPKIVIQNDGKVGIGETTPSHSLDIMNTAAGADLEGIQIHNNSANLNTSSSIVFTNSTNDLYRSAKISAIRTDSPASGSCDLSFWTGKATILTECMRLKSEDTANSDEVCEIIKNDDSATPAGGAILTLRNSNTNLNRLASLNFDFAGGTSQDFARIIVKRVNTGNADMWFQLAKPDPGSGVTLCNNKMIIYSDGKVAIGDPIVAPDAMHVLRINGRIQKSGCDFVITHPLDSNKELVHSSLEGPESGVYYRGESQLTKGSAVIALPNYFEALTKKENRTALLTCIDGWSPLYVDGKIEDGKFVVKTGQVGNTNQKFYWEVKAVRADVETLAVEQSKDSTIDKQEQKKD
jgi:hypothetical protein